MDPMFTVVTLGGAVFYAVSRAVSWLEDRHEKKMQAGREKARRGGWSKRAGKGAP